MTSTANPESAILLPGAPLCEKSSGSEYQKHLDEIRAIGKVDLGPLKSVIFPLSEIDKVKDEERLKGWKMKIVHYVRHGEAMHNLAAATSKTQPACGCKLSPPGPCVYKDPALTDPALTPLGEEQARSHQEHAKNLRVDLVAVSPLKRTLQTAALAFAETLGGSRPAFIAVEELREQQGVHLGDKRRPTSEAAKEFNYVDFSLCPADDDKWSDNVREPRLDIAKRGYRYLRWVHDREEANIAVVSHSSFLLTLFNLCLETDNTMLKQWFATGELRSVVQFSKLNDI